MQQSEKLIPALSNGNKMNIAENVPNKDIFQKIFDLNPLGFSILEADTLKYVEANENYLNIIGFQREEIIGHTAYELNIRPNNVKEEVFFNVLTKDTIKNKVTSFRKKSGELRSVEYSSSPIDIEGLKYILFLINDVTERERIEKENQESNEFLLKMFDTIPLGVALFDAETFSYIRVNDVYQNLTGYNRDELIKKATSDLSITTPEFRARLIEDIKLSTSLKNVKCEFRRKNGEIREGEIFFSKIMVNDRLCFLKMLDDVTEREKSEKQNRESKELFQNMFDMSALGMALIDAETLEFIQINSVYLNMLGYERDEVIGKKSPELEISTQPFRNKILNDIKSITTLKNIKYDFRKKSGEIRQSELSISKLMVNDRLCFLNILNDVTERVIAEKKIQESKDIFENIFNMSPLGMFLLDAHSLEFIEVNPVYLDLVGYSREEILGKKTPELSISSPEVRAHILSTMSMTPTIKNIKYKFLKKTGDVCLGELSISKLMINNRLCFLNILNDVTEREKAVQENLDSKEFFAKLFHLSPSGITLVSAENLKYIETNDNFLKMTGFTREELIGHSIYESNINESEILKETNPNLVLKSSFLNRFFYLKTKAGNTFVGEVFTEIIYLNNEKCFLSIINDVTERDKIEKEIKESREYFAKLFQLSPSGISLINAKTLEYIDVNDNYLKLTGFTREELIGQSIFGTDSLDHELRKEAIKKIELQGTMSNRVLNYKTKSGDSFIGEVSTDIVYLRNEKYFLSVINDVTERTKIEKKNQESRELFTKIFELNPFAVALIKTETLRYVEVNNNFLQLTGYNKEEIIGHTVSSMNPSTQAALEKIQIGLKPDNLIKNGVFKYQKKSGEVRTGNISTEIININDEKYFLSIFNDITEKNIAEEKAHLLATSLEEAQRLGKIGSWEWDVEKNVINWSPELYCLYGLENRSFQNIGQEFQEALHPEDKDRVNLLIIEARIQKKFPDYSYRIIRKNDGAVRHLHARGSVKIAEDGRLIKMNGTAQDITEQKHIEEILSQNALKLDLALDASKIGSWELDLVTNTYINSLRHDQIFGYEKTVEHWSKDILFKHIFPEDRTKVEEEFEKSVTTGEDLYFETRIKHLDGRTRWIWVRGQIFKDSFGKQNRMSGLIQDFTERKRAELEMWQYARNIIEADLNPVIIIDFNGKITDMNAAFISVNTIDRENILNTSFTQYFTEPDKAAVIFHEVFEQGSVKSQRVKLNNTAQTEVLLNGSVYKDEQGNVRGAVMVARDITELLSAQQMIIAHEKRFSDIISQSMLLVAILKGKDMVIEFANEKILKSWGRGREIINMPLLTALPELEDQDFPKFLQNVYETGIPHNQYEAKAVILRDGKYEDNYYTYAYLPYMESDGNIGGITILATDVTEQVATKKQQLENTERLQFIFDAIPQKVWTADVKGSINYFNKKWFEDIQFDIESLKHGGWKKILHPHDQTINEQVWQQAMFTGESFQIEQRFLHNDGTYRWHLNRGLPYKSKSGKILMWVGTFTDIHEQKKLVETLEVTAKIAEEEKMRAETAKSVAENAVKAKQRFLANMSHEIRTPMNAIIGFTKVVLKTDLSKKQIEYLQAIKTSGDTLIILLNDILDLAKVDAGKMTFEHIPFKPELSVSAMLHLFEPKIQEKNLELIKIYDPNIPQVLLGDPARLHQIILNLVSNAVKFTSTGSIVVSVQLQKENNDEVEVGFSVSDTGIGMTEDTIKVIFDNFEQASSSTSRIYGGTGLGLAIVKQLVESQGGTISVDSKINAGSTFSISLSFKKTKIQLTSEVEAEGVVNDLKNIKILVVEDVALNQLLMRTLLDEYGFGCTIAENGKIAIEKMKVETFDIILMDLQMPEMDGFETTEYIRKTFRSDVPIIALTADVTTADLSKCTSVGMDEYISKPLDEKLLYAKILNLLKRTAMKNAEATKIIQNSVEKKIKYTDLKYLNERTKSNPAVIKQMIELYLEQTPPLVESMKKSFEEKNWHKLHATVHKMIPSFSIVGIDKNYEDMAKKIMDLARAQEHADDLHGMITQLGDICSNACTELQEYFNTLK